MGQYSGCRSARHECSSRLWEILRSGTRLPIPSSRRHQLVRPHWRRHSKLHDFYNPDRYLISTVVVRSPRFAVEPAGDELARVNFYGFGRLCISVVLKWNYCNCRPTISSRRWKAPNPLFDSLGLSNSRTFVAAGGLLGASRDESGTTAERHSRLSVRVCLSFRD